MLIEEISECPEIRIWNGVESRFGANTRKFCFDKNANALSRIFKIVFSSPASENAI